jgi:hypothetical protein
LNRIHFREEHDIALIPEFVPDTFFIRRSIPFLLENFNHLGDVYHANKQITFLAVEGLEFHFLKELGQLLFGRDFIEVDGVDVLIDEFLFEVELLNVPDALLVLCDDVDIAFGPCLLLGFGWEEHVGFNGCKVFYVLGFSID